MPYLFVLHQNVSKNIHFNVYAHVDQLMQPKNSK